MSQKGFAMPIIIIGLVVLAAGAFWIYSYNKPSPIVAPTQEITYSPSATASAEVVESPVASAVAKAKASPSPATSCDTAKDVCFDTANAKVTIQEGVFEDSNFWVSSELSLIGKGTGGYNVTINGFPKEFSVRVPDQNFAPGAKGKLLIRAQKDVAAKGSHTGTISVKSLITNVSSVIPLTINYVDWNTAAVKAEPGSITLDCSIIRDPDDANSRELNCGNYDNHYLKFYSYKNNKTIEIRTLADNNSRGITLDTEYSHSQVLTPGKDVYTLHYDPKGIDFNNINSEQDGVYKGSFAFVEQVTQKEILRIPYTLIVHAFKP